MNRKAPRSRSARLILGIGTALASIPLAALLAAPLATALGRPVSPHGKFRGACADCHSASTWTPARIGPRFDHAKFGFPLEGAHAAASCRGCHATLDFTQEKQLCASCHEDAHQGELGTDCARCHGARSFIDRSAMTRMHQASRFPLTGRHAALECEDCHRPAAAGHLRFVGTRAECVECHRSDFEGARNPDHQAGNFPRDCMTCHTTASWSGGRFMHDFTGFPLTGAHRSLACARCHSNGTYQGLSAACVSCHQADYDATANPSHTALGFSTQCQTCHTTATWAGATFDHDTQNFPIYSGTHAGKWASCSTCHTNLNDFTQFTCFSCHPHSDQTQTNSNHTSVSGYSYTSQACYSCHPRGRK